MASILILITQFLSLSFWVGGSLTLVLVVHPVMTSSPERSETDRIRLGLLLQRFRVWFVGITLVLLSTTSVQLLLLRGEVSLKLKVVLVLTGVALLSTVYGIFGNRRPQNLFRQLKNITKPADVESLTKQGNHRLDLEQHNRSALALLHFNLMIGIAVVLTFLIPV
jgi:uncharacterized membrane protein